MFNIDFKNPRMPEEGTGGGEMVLKPTVGVGKPMTILLYIQAQPHCVFSKNFTEKTYFKQSTLLLGKATYIMWKHQIGVFLLGSCGREKAVWINLKSNSWVSFASVHTA